ncbi:MAG: NAD(P)/FAD-dependent oxidoreductase [Verrucomicrobiae bacterium]|nr:NAD(P)/FAD-dependent oxidoreductase [Verrucomicrobiae bacterium]
MPEESDVLIIGGGAAGLMCALTAGARGRSVTLLEHNDRVGKKIAISGGGRCNFTNLGASPENYLSDNPDFCRSALARYTPADFIRLVEKHGIAYHEKKLGQLFCNTSAKEIINMLLAECARSRVRLSLETRVCEIRKSDRFEVLTNLGTFCAPSLVMACGGLSLPKLGATDLAYRIARQFGLRQIPARAGLVPLTLSGEWLGHCRALAGVSLEARVTYEKRTFQENILFTHRGLSGPAILQISSHWNPGEPLSINLLPGRSVPEVLGDPTLRELQLDNALGRVLPSRLAALWGSQLGPLRKLKQYNPPELARLGAMVNDWSPVPEGTEGYATAEVTVGGIDTRDLNQKTMEARSVPGLFFIGEAVDVTGWLGGYNFQWAWASGHAAGGVV